MGKLTGVVCEVTVAIHMLQHTCSAEETVGNFKPSRTVNATGLGTQEASRE